MKVLLSFKNNPSKFLTVENFNVFMRNRMPSNPAQNWNIWEHESGEFSFKCDNGFSLGYSSDLNNIAITNKIPQFLNNFTLDDEGRLKTNDDRYLWYIGDQVYLTQDEYLAEPVELTEVEDKPQIPSSTSEIMHSVIVAIFVVIFLLVYQYGISH